MSANTLISNLISSQLPDFVRADHPNFVAFIEAYYEYLEQSNTTIQLGKTVERAKNMREYIDIDRTIDGFAQKFYDEFLALLPKDTAADKKLLLKNIKDFYRARGTEKSFRFLFRALFNKEPEFYYPKSDILIASSGTWFIERSLRVGTILVDAVSSNTLEGLQSFENTQITGSTSGATAIVERVIISYEEGSQIFELYLSNALGTFENGETITTTNVDDEDLSAVILSEQLSTIRVTEGGNSYNIGDTVIIESNTGTGAAATVSAVSRGNVSAVYVNLGGAGFRTNDVVIFTGGGGTGATANVGAVLSNNYYHANTYNINSDLILTYANTLMNIANYAFPAYANANANTVLSDAFTNFLFGPTGPIISIDITAAGNDYISLPTAEPVGNTRIKNLGIIGRFNINNGGLGYSVNDRLQFTNIPGGYGYGANAYVSSVAGNGMVQHITIAAIASGHLPGGVGYNPNYYPTINVASSGGTGANITVAALLGYGTPATSLTANTSTVGVLETITITARGLDYASAPTINLTTTGSGTAQAVATVSTGVFAYPGRYLDDTGFPSGFNFLQDRDYYQNYSYVIKVRESIDNYRQFLKDILAPAGMKLFGQYMLDGEAPIDDAMITFAESEIDLETLYVANAVSFNTANTFLYANTQPGNSNLSAQGTFSVWINLNTMPATNTAQTYIYFAGNTNSSPRFAVSVANNYITSNNFTNYVKIEGRDVTGNVVLDLRSNTATNLRPNVWMHILSSWNLTVGNSHLYITNVASQNAVTLTAASNVTHNVTFTGVGADHRGAGRFNGCMTELWYDDTYINLSNVTNRQKFISNDILPVSLGANGATPTGTVPIQYLRYANVAFANSASNPSNNLSISGTITVCNTSPTTT